MVEVEEIKELLALEAKFEKLWEPFFKLLEERWGLDDDEEYTELMKLWGAEEFAELKKLKEEMKYVDDEFLHVFSPIEDELTNLRETYKDLIPRIKKVLMKAKKEKTVLPKSKEKK